MKHFSLGKEEKMLKSPEFRRAMRKGESQSTDQTPFKGIL
jgi:hypothetical protein